MLAFIVSTNDAYKRAYVRTYVRAYQYADDMYYAYIYIISITVLNRKLVVGYVKLINYILIN